MLLCETLRALAGRFPFTWILLIVLLLPSKYGRKTSHNHEDEAVTYQTRLRFTAVLMYELKADVKYVLHSPRPIASCNMSNYTSPCCHQE